MEYRKVLMEKFRPLLHERDKQMCVRDYLFLWFMEYLFSMLKRGYPLEYSLGQSLFIDKVT